LTIHQIYTPELKQFVQDHLDRDPAQLFLSLRGKVDFDLKFAIEQLKARQKALKKFPSWANNFSLIFPATLSLEQASSEETARFKSKLLNGRSMIDLTGGFGVDTYYLAGNFSKAIYCERNEELVDIFKYNMDVLGESRFEVNQGDSLQILSQTPESFDLIYVDPARRGGHNQKLYKLSDCEPDLVSNWELLKGKGNSIFIKASPMLDLKQAIQELPDIQQIWVVSVKNEVKEVLLYWQKDKKKAERLIHCVDLSPKGNTEFTFSFESEELASNAYSEVKAFIIEPLASLLKAGAFKSFGERFGLPKLHPNSHLFTSDTNLTNIPARIFKVIEEVRQAKKEIPKLFPSGKVNVITRNFVLSAEEVKKKYKLKDGGDDFLIATKIGERYRIFYCKKVQKW
jgi:16S rRNA G966 N2-methylase RsmD